MSVVLTGDTGTELGVRPSSQGEVEVRQLGWRMTDCADQADAALAKLAQLQLNQWQSPAGRAYRTTLAWQTASLRKGRDALREAAAATLRFAENVALDASKGF